MHKTYTFESKSNEKCPNRAENNDFGPKNRQITYHFSFLNSFEPYKAGKAIQKPRGRTPKKR